MAIVGVVVVVLGGIGVLCALFVGSALVRAAVTLTNRMLGPSKLEPVDPIEDWDWDGDLGPVLPRRRGGGGGVPVPTYGNGMVIAFLATLATGGAFSVLAVLADEFGVGGAVPQGWATLTAAVLALVPGFAALTLLLIVLLPTTLPRAALTAFVHHALALFVVLAATTAFVLAAALLG